VGLCRFAARHGRCAESPFPAPPLTPLGRARSLARSPARSARQATMPPAVEKLARTYMRAPAYVYVGEQVTAAACPRARAACVPLARACARLALRAVLSVSLFSN
jgi:hypothetical protein